MVRTKGETDVDYEMIDGTLTPNLQVVDTVDFQYEGVKIGLTRSGEWFRCDVGVNNLTFKNYELIESYMKIFRHMLNHLPEGASEVFLQELKGENEHSDWKSEFVTLVQKIYNAPVNISIDGATKVAEFWEKMYHHSFLAMMQDFLRLAPDNLDLLKYLDKLAKVITGYEVTGNLKTQIIGVIGSESQWSGLDEDVINTDGINLDVHPEDVAVFKLEDNAPIDTTGINLDVHPDDVVVHSSEES